MAADWHPAQDAQPAEWELRSLNATYALVRRLEFPAYRANEIWFRAVTYSPNPTHRRLIGYCRTFEDACRAAWEHHLEEARRAHAIAGRGGYPSYASPQPAGATRSPGRRDA